jgi:hypothetical protein
LTYIRYFHERELAGYPWLPAFIDSLRREQSGVEARPDIAHELESHVLTLPIRIKELLGSGQDCGKELAQFRRKITELQRRGI